MYILAMTPKSHSVYEMDPRHAAVGIRVADKGNPMVGYPSSDTLRWLHRQTPGAQKYIIIDGYSLSKPSADSACHSVVTEKGRVGLTINAELEYFRSRGSGCRRFTISVWYPLRSIYFASAYGDAEEHGSSCALENITAHRRSRD